MKTNGKDQAFPVAGSEDQTIWDGLTKREYFAIEIFKAMMTRTPQNDDSTATAVQRADSLIDALNRS